MKRDENLRVQITRAGKTNYCLNSNYVNSLEREKENVQSQYRHVTQASSAITDRRFKYGNQLIYSNTSEKS